jgi:mannose-1-phosphate guanylyltransferase
LVRAGALWNAFIIAADGRALLALYERHCGELLRRMHQAVDGAKNCDGTALKVFYEELPDIDFCRDLLESTDQPLRVLAVPQCGWSDLGTPERVAEVLLGGTRAPASRRETAHGSSLSLAAQHGRHANEARSSAG